MGDDFIKFFELQRTYCSYCMMRIFRIEYCPGCKYFRKKRGTLDKFMPTREYLELMDKYLKSHERK